MNVNLDPIYSMSRASLGGRKDASQWGNVEGSQLVFSFETLRAFSSAQFCCTYSKSWWCFFSQGACDLVEAGLA